MKLYVIMLLNREAALVRNLTDVKDVLAAAGVRYWLDYGTLLGAVREKRVLGWESDIDLSILSVDWNRIRSVIPQLQSLGFYVALTEAIVHETECLQFIWFRRFGINFDIFVYQIKDGRNAVAFDVADNKGSTSALGRMFRWSHLLLDNSVYSATSRVCTEHVLLEYVFVVAARLLRVIPSRPRKKLAVILWKLRPLLGVRVARFVVPRRFFQRLETVQMYGLDLCAPSNAEEYLSLHYGDWRTPDDNWDWGSDRTINGYF